MSIELTKNGFIVDLDAVKDTVAMIQSLHRQSPNSVTFKGNSEHFQSEIQSLANAGFNVIVSGNTNEGHTTLMQG